MNHRAARPCTPLTAAHCRIFGVAGQNPAMTTRSGGRRRRHRAGRRGVAGPFDNSGGYMDRISIVGGRPLHGAIPISGAKNATLPLMIASLLTKDTLILDNVPRLADVSQLQRILSNHGVDILTNGKRPGDTAYQGQTLHISAADI